MEFHIPMVSYNSGTATAVASFPYTATLPGTYVFTVTDSRGLSNYKQHDHCHSKNDSSALRFKKLTLRNGLDNGTITVTASGRFTTT
jgi:hypothetical protein